MSAVIFSPENITPQDLHHLEDFFLHPSCRPNSLEIFALKGKEEDYIRFTASVRDSLAAKAGFRRHGVYPFKLEDQLEWIDFKPWFEKELDHIIEGYVSLPIKRI